MNTTQICAVTVMDTSDPGITFDVDHVSHYVHAARHRLQTECFRGPSGDQRLSRLVETIKREGRGKHYDCVAGISGGMDSSYVLVRAVELGLRPLAIHLDNGWNSEVAVANIERILRGLDLDLFTHVVDWDEIKDLQRAFFRASMSNVEVVTDHAITALLYQQAAMRGVRFILSGSNVETESIMPDAWGYDPRDARHILAIHRAFGQRKLRTYPILSAPMFLWSIFMRRTRHIPLLNYAAYRKAEISKLLAERFGWVPYARKHGESRFTRFFQEYYLPEKFGFDKRRAHLSSLIVSGQISRDEAMAELTQPLFTPHERELEIEYVTRKLGFSMLEWDAIMQTPERSYREFANNAWMFDHSSPLTQMVRRTAKGERVFSAVPYTQSVERQSHNAARTICHLTFGPFLNEARAVRAASSALQSGEADRVVFLGYSDEGVSSREQPMPNCETIRLSRPKVPLVPRVVMRSLQWAVWSVRAIAAGRKIRPDLIQCHSLASLPPAVVLKRLMGVPLIYDAHELETERPSWGAVQKAVARWLERRLIDSCDHTFTVSETITQWYRDNYRISELSLLRNVPWRPDLVVSRNRLLREAFSISDDELVFLYLGAVGTGRGTQQIIDAFRELAADRHVIFLGGTPHDQEFDGVREAARLSPNIHWHAAVPNHEVVSYAAGADVGISLIEDVCLSYRFCLPNKVHECRLAGLPLIVSDLPELARYVDDSGAGWKISPTSDALYDLVSALEARAIQEKLKQVRTAPLTWNDEQERYLTVLRRLRQESPQLVTA